MKRAEVSWDIAVVRVDLSPMSPRRWVLTLACGHEVWVTASRKPGRETCKCETCARGAI